MRRLPRGLPDAFPVARARRFNAPRRLAFFISGWGPCWKRWSRTNFLLQCSWECCLSRGVRSKQGQDQLCNPPCPMQNLAAHLPISTVLVVVRLSCLGRQPAHPPCRSLHCQAGAGFDVWCVAVAATMQMLAFACVCVACALVLPC